jgi:chromosome segregation ATPase
MSDILDKRVTDIETVVWSLPNLLTDRMTGVQAALTTLSARVEHVERMQTMLQTDTRDMRGGVTRQLVAQDQTIRDVVARLERLEQRQERLEQRVAGVETALKDQEKRLAGIDASIAALDKNVTAKLDQIISRLPRS